jgi:hypothetical protein
VPLDAEASEAEVQRARRRVRDAVAQQAKAREPSRLAEEFGDALGLLTYELGAHGTGEGVLAHRSLREAVERLAPGQLSPVLRSSEGLHVFYMVARQEAGLGSLEEARARVEHAVSQRKYSQALEQWMAGLWERYEVQVLLGSGGASAPARP